jgi:hypothetical protein
MMTYIISPSLDVTEKVQEARRRYVGCLIKCIEERIRIPEVSSNEDSERIWYWTRKKSGMNHKSLFSCAKLGLGNDRGSIGTLYFVWGDTQGLLCKSRCKEMEEIWLLVSEGYI